MGRDDPEPPDPQDVDHASVTTGRRGLACLPCCLLGLKFPASPIGDFAPSIPISLEPAILFSYS